MLQTHSYSDQTIRERVWKKKCDGGKKAQGRLWHGEDMWLHFDEVIKWSRLLSIFITFQHEFQAHQLRTTGWRDIDRWPKAVNSKNHSLQCKKFLIVIITWHIIIPEFYVAWGYELAQG